MLLVILVLGFVGRADAFLYDLDLDNAFYDSLTNTKWLNISSTSYHTYSQSVVGDRIKLFPDYRVAYKSEVEELTKSVILDPSYYSEAELAYMSAHTGPSDGYNDLSLPYRYYVETIYGDYHIDFVFTGGVTQDILRETPSYTTRVYCGIGGCGDGTQGYDDDAFNEKIGIWALYDPQLVLAKTSVLREPLPAPEPSTLALFSLGGFGYMFKRRFIKV